MSRFNLKKEYAKTRQAREMYKQIIKIDAEYSDAKISAENAIQRYTDNRAGEILSEIDTDSLKSYKLGIRTSLLKESGFNTIKDLYFTSKTKLTAVNGIGSQQVSLIKGIADDIYKNARATVRLKLDTDNPTEETDDIIKAIYFYRESLKYHPDVITILKDKEKFTEADNLIKKYLSFFRWTFASQKDKEKCREATETLSDIFTEEFEIKSDEIIAEYDKLKNTDKNSIYSDFTVNSPYYYSIIESISPSLFRGNKTGLGISEQLSDEIENVPLCLDGMKSTLRGYQRFGVQYILKQNNVLLGDEMGLGKTIEAIAAISALHSAGETHFMIVCPSGIRENWRREIVKHSYLTAISVYGDDIQQNFQRWIEDGGVAVTTFEMANRLFLPQNFTYSMLCIDEAHFIKNPQAMRTKSVLRLKLQAKRALFMSGTPLENNVDEMCFLIRCLNSDIADEADKLKRLSQAPLFREVIAPVYIRRTREDVLMELPDLIENIEWCLTTNYERRIYNESVKLKRFTDMRRISWNVDDLQYSSKAQRLIDICNNAREEGRKIIVFSCFRNTVDAVCSLLADRCYGPITGSVSAEDRQTIIDEFSDAPSGSVLVSQIDAGGTGLNIQSASVVVLCEPQLKPSSENQAISRVYRMGQIRNVLVYRLLCIDSIDEYLMDILYNKQNLFNEFAEDSVRGRENIEISESDFKRIIEFEIDRIKTMNAALYDLGDYSIRQ